MPFCPDLIHKALSLTKHNTLQWHASFLSFLTHIQTNEQTSISVTTLNYNRDLPRHLHTMSHLQY